MTSDTPFQLTHRIRKEFDLLDEAKWRRRTGLFPAEGTKCVLELAAAFRPRTILATAEWINEHGATVAGVEVTAVAPRDLRELTRLTSTPPVIATFELPDDAEVPDRSYFNENLVLMLDRVQDPGNLGTILRTCDWMGVRTIIASQDTVDCFNPKVVQATMGGLARTRIIYTDLEKLLDQLDDSVAVCGTFLDGENIYTAALPSSGILLMGNEGRGISDTLASAVNRRLLIPAYPGADKVESLNVAVATAIALSQFRMRLFQ